MSKFVSTGNCQLCDQSIAKSAMTRHLKACRGGASEKPAIDAGARAFRLLVEGNHLPPIACETCGQPATQVCSCCVWQAPAWCCDACAKKHECGEEMMLPVVNSPRVGMCGYRG